MNFRTAINFPGNLGYIDHRQQILLLGSCFAENIGLWLQQRKFNVDINPFGTLYNPLSIAQSWERIVEGKAIIENELFAFNNLWHSYDHHSRFSGCDKKAKLSLMNRRIEKAHRQVPNIDRIIIANCHKQPASIFDRMLLSVDEIVSRWRDIIKYIEDNLPQCRILFTVSPIRHLSDGAHGNQISKSTLLLAINRLQQEFGICDYFPSYEIMMDDLRDYRFYDTDMTHPSKSAIAYITEILEEAYLSPESKEIASQWYKIQRALEHRPLMPDKDEYTIFLQHTLDKVMRFQQMYPYINVSNEITELNTRISQI